MESDGVTARQQLDELERRRGEVAERLVMPAWHRALWALTWSVMLIALISMAESDVALVVYPLTLMTLGFLFWWERSRSGVRVPRSRRRWATRDWGYLVLGVAVFSPAFYLYARHDLVWPMAISYLVGGVAMFYDLRREDRRRAEELRRS